MVLAEITGYSVGVFIHILAVVLAFGPTFAYGLIYSVLPKYPRAAPALFDAMGKVDNYLVNPAMLVVLLAGVYVMADGNWGGDETFITVGFLAIIILLGMQHAFFRPQGRKARELAERDLKNGDTFSAEFDEATRRLSTAGPIAGLIVVVTIFFMTVKP